MKNLKEIKLYILIVATIFMFGCKKDDINLTNGKSFAVFNSTKRYGTMKDREGNVYKTITIGTQTWSAENLRTKVYNDGTIIPNIIDNSEWMTLSSGACCTYKNTLNKDSIATYGRLYNGLAVNTGKLAPKGWRVATDEDWTTLINYLGGTSLAGDKIKESGSVSWQFPNEGASNESGFTALGAGYRLNIFYDLSRFTGFWTRTSDGIIYLLGSSSSYAPRSYSSLNAGYSVRLVKD